MVGTLIVGSVIFILAAGGGLWLVMRVQREYLERAHKEHQGRERALEARLQAWEQHYEREITSLKQELSRRLEQFQESNTLQHEQTVQQLGIELELARLPRVDETPILSQAAEQGIGMPNHWRPATLYRADLRLRDLSHRYLGKADLRGARLIGANLSMADFSRASLSGADLSRANLTGANLAGADLSHANLSEATLLVADLQQTNLKGANLKDVYNLTVEQLRSAIRDSSTQVALEADETSPRLPALRAPRLQATTNAARPEPRPVPSAPVRSPEPPTAEVVQSRQPDVPASEPEQLPFEERVSASSWEAPQAEHTEPPASEPEQLPFEERVSASSSPTPQAEQVKPAQLPFEERDKAQAPAANWLETLGMDDAQAMPAPMLDELIATTPDAAKPEPEIATEESVPEPQPALVGTSSSSEAEMALNRPPETPFATPMLDTLPFIEQLVDTLPSKPAIPAPTTTNTGSLLDTVVTDHLLDTQELKAIASSQATERMP